MSGLFPNPSAESPSNPFDAFQFPEPLDVKRPIRWLGDDGRNVFVELQGNVVCVAYRQGPLSYIPPKRQEIGGFSRESRMRLFKLTNRIDFQAAGRVTFVTTTWRDEVGRPSPSAITRARSAWQKTVERHARKRMPGIWRTEWKNRLSGRYAGQPMPHLHTLYFRAPYMEKQAISEGWARAIGWDGRISVRLEEVVNLRACLSYVSKYLAKICDLGNLDIVAYLAAPSVGRQWGTYRKNELPLADKWEFRVAPGELADKIRAIATKHWSKISQEKHKGYVVFGGAAEEISAMCEENLLSTDEHLIDLSSQGD